MATTNIEKVLTLFRGIANRDPDLAIQYLHPQKYTEHNPHAADGIEGFRAYVQQLSRQDYLTVVRTFADGPYVFTQADGRIAEPGTFFDVFRFEDERIVEHWGFPEKVPPKEPWKNNKGILYYFCL